MRQRKKVSPPNTAPARELTHDDIVDPAFEVREGDTLSVTYNGAKVSINGTYSSVELDGAHYKRTLREGDDPGEEFERIYTFLKTRSEARARAKLTHFVDQIRKADARAQGHSKGGE